ncbi:hypothetical protein CR513_40230, partial [Mucuna pruriens]
MRFLRGTMDYGTMMLTRSLIQMRENSLVNVFTLDGGAITSWSTK